MSAIETQITNGHLVSIQPVDLPEGTRLTVVPQDDPDDSDELLGTSPEAIARWLAEFDALPTPIMSPEEEAAWQNDRRSQREYELATLDIQTKRIEGLVE